MKSRAFTMADYDVRRERAHARKLIEQMLAEIRRNSPAESPAGQPQKEHRMKIENATVGMAVIYKQGRGKGTATIAGVEAEAARLLLENGAGRKFTRAAAKVTPAK